MLIENCGCNDCNGLRIENQKRIELIKNDNVMPSDPNIIENLFNMFNQFDIFHCIQSTVVDYEEFYTKKQICVLKGMIQTLQKKTT